MRRSAQPQRYKKDLEMSPRVRLAARLYATGVAATKAQAADQAGLARATFYITSTQKPFVTDYIREIDRELESGQIQMGRLLQRMGRRAVRNIAHMAEDVTLKDEVRLKANQDLADRSPETSKVLKVDASITTPISISQFEELRAAMLESAKLREKFARAEHGSFVTVSDGETARNLELVKVHSLPASAEPSSNGVGD